MMEMLSAAWRETRDQRGGFPGGTYVRCPSPLHQCGKARGGNGAQVTGSGGNPLVGAGVRRVPRDPVGRLARDRQRLSRPQWHG